ncbi:acetoin utilization protein AcuC [Arthrobacter castelli]|uniref:acetoin utilization protein AcuC n=1 Tax=Arthrobacter castelli TaxID=271431 RepID=UPI0005623896|nr:acetoin utilization protein AcuC [Arthrobacter castelli]
MRIKSSPPTVPGSVHVVWDESLMAYNFGAHHPMQPARLDLTARLARELGLFDLPAVEVIPSVLATDDELATVHSREYIEAVRHISAHPDDGGPAWGLGTEDTPAAAGIHEASARIAGASLTAADSLLSGTALHAVNFSGGLHHASRNRASGFCIYNDAAAAIARLLDGGTSRVMYIDIDAHHGDGTESIFWNDPRVLTVSLHETGMRLFPGSGFANEIGGPGAQGSAVNVALPDTIDDGGWLRAFHAIVPQLAGAFEPEVIVSQHGCDSHHLDPLSHLGISVDAQRQAAVDIAELAVRHCGGRWLATGGGGYSLTDVVPRVWSHLIGIAAGEPVPVTRPVPEAWREYVDTTYGIDAPRLMGDDVDVWWRSWEVGYDPNNDVDRTVVATRKEVFPLYGLDPWFD